LRVVRHEGVERAEPNSFGAHDRRASIYNTGVQTSDTIAVALRRDAGPVPGDAERAGIADGDAVR